jgi:putative peptidoglycan lipid II flippase
MSSEGAPPLVAPPVVTPPPSISGQSVIQPSPELSSRNSQAAIARNATIVSIGNLSSRVIGLAREMVKSFYFGNGQAASAFELAATVPTVFYDLLVGGMLSSSLVPTFSALADDEHDTARLREFGELLGALIGLASVLLAALIAVLWLFALPIAHLIGGGPNQDTALVASLLRLTIPAILFLSLGGIITAALYARRRFAFTAFTATAFNLTMIACVVLSESQLGVMALALGMLAGSLVQVMIQLPGLRGVPIRLSLNWRLPGVSQILRLFAPVAGGLIVAQMAVLVSFIVASRISEEGPATMRYAAQVIQFPLGMIVTAVSAAILPALSSTAASQLTRLAVGGSNEDFKATLIQGLRLVLVLILPASVGLYVLAAPVIALLFQHGAFTAESTAYTASALRAAIPGLIFAAIDQPLIYAFYAQRDTRTPTLIGIVSTLFYLLLIGALVWLAQSNLRLFTLDDLILANSLKIGVDAALMAAFLRRKIGGLGGFGLSRFVFKVCIGSAVMGLAVWLTMNALLYATGFDTFFDEVVVAVGAALVGLAVYAACTWLMRVPELWMLVNSRRLRKS